MRSTANYFSNSDITILDNIVQNIAMEGGRNLLIDVLRECFSRDRQYHWVPDPWGFNKTPSADGLAADAGMTDGTTTRISIGSAYRAGNAFLPSITVRQTRLSYKPVSFNQNKWDLEYGEAPIMDSLGTIVYVRQPVAYNIVGYWEASFDIKIKTESLEDTTKLHDLVVVALQSTYRPTLQQSGLFIKEVSSSGEGTEDGPRKDPAYVTTVSVNTLSEWRRRIPISTAVERLQVCIDLDITEDDTPPRGGEVRISIQPAGDFKVYFGGDSFELVNEANIITLDSKITSTPAGTYSADAGALGYVYFATPSAHPATFSGIDMFQVGTIVIGGIDYAIYRSNTQLAGAVSFIVA